jgi:CPA2 family monovalent cation:H+ antiporter-2
MFSGIFFISVGMLLELRMVLESFAWVGATTFAVLFIKTAIATVVVWAMGRPFQTSLVSGLGLAQVGEFSFVLAGVGHSLGLFVGEQYQLFLSASVASMLLAPFLIAGARPFAETVGRALRLRELAPLPNDQASVAELADHAVLVGYGLSGRHLVRVLKAADIPYVVIEQNGQLVRRARADKVNIIFGDGARREVLHRVGIGRARVVVFAIASPVDERRGIAMARHLNPTVRIVVRTRYVMAIDDLMQLGASEVVVEEFEATLELFARILEFYEIPGKTIQRELDIVRSEHYSIMRDESLPKLKLDTLRHMGIHEALEVVEVEEGARALGESVAFLRLRQETGAAVIAVVRKGRALYPPDPCFEFRQGDTVVLVGNPNALIRGVAVFRTPGKR